MKTPEQIAHETVEASFHEFEDHTSHVERLIEKAIEADRAQREEFTEAQVSAARNAFWANAGDVPKEEANAMRAALEAARGVAE